jgi:hypothetical protein
VRHVRFTINSQGDKKMIHRFSHAAALVALIGSFVAISATSAFAQGGNNPNRNRLDVPVTGVVKNADGTPAGALAGTVAISKFAIQDGTLMAVGQLTGTVTDAAGNVVRNVVTIVAMPVANGSGSGDADAFGSCDSGSAAAACDILNLVLGPLHLDLLGLVIDLNQVVLQITGATGTGDLLGNLLCAITGLLDAGSIGQQLVNLLNQLIGVLAGL